MLLVNRLDGALSTSKGTRKMEKGETRDRTLKCRGAQLCSPKISLSCCAFCRYFGSNSRCSPRTQRCPPQSLTPPQREQSSTSLHRKVSAYFAGRNSYPRRKVRGKTNTVAVSIHSRAFNRRLLSPSTALGKMPVRRTQDCPIPTCTEWLRVSRGLPPVGCHRNPKANQPL